MKQRVCKDTHFPYTVKINFKNILDKSREKNPSIVPVLSSVQPLETVFIFYL